MFVGIFFSGMTLIASLVENWPDTGNVGGSEGFNVDQFHLEGFEILNDINSSNMQTRLKMKLKADKKNFKFFQTDL